MKPSRLITIGALLIILAIASLLLTPMMKSHSDLMRMKAKTPEEKIQNQKYEDQISLPLLLTGVSGAIGIGFVAIGALRTVRK